MIQRRLKGWAVPLTAGLVAGVFALWIGWWALLITVGFAFGYFDPWDARGERRR